MIVRYSRGAQADLEAISSYLRERSPSVANAAIRTIEGRISRLADFPLAEPLTDVPGLRELTIVRYPNKIYYQLIGEEIWIVHVRDARPRPFLDEIS